MEIVLENKKMPIYRETHHQIKTIQESAETVVPDVNEDIGKIASIQSTLTLKSKDIVNDGVSISGEANITVLYITETEDSVAHIKLSKSFSIQYEIPDIKQDNTAQINLQLSNIEARVINPRKVSVTLEICGELSCFSSEAIDELSLIPEEYSNVLKANNAAFEVMLPNSVCEKTFAINEQFIFPAAKAEPNKIVFSKVNLNVTDSQHVGSKLIVKGTTNISVCYTSNDAVHPIFTQFTSAFSQIIDTGCESIDNCSYSLELTSCYFDLLETISGEHALDVELHAVIQIVCRKKQKIQYISDMYSNLMPLNMVFQDKTITDTSEIKYDRVSINEKLSVADECEDILCVIPSISQMGISDTTMRGTICFDIIYKNKGGSISAVHRSINPEVKELLPGSRLVSYKLNNMDIHPYESIVDVQCALEYAYQSFTKLEYSRVDLVEMNEEQAYDTSAFPSVTMVRFNDETLWELAKTYHSSVEKICENNDMENLKASFVMIPKES